MDVTRQGWRQEGSLGHTDFGDAVETNIENELHVRGGADESGGLVAGS